MLNKNIKSENVAMKFVKTFITTFLLFTLFITIGMTSYVTNANSEIIAESNGESTIANIFDKIEEKDIYNIAIFGVDKAGVRTDVIFVCSVDFKNSKINILSVPRDTKIYVDDDMYMKLKNKRYVPRDRNVKITEIHAYAGKENANEVSRETVEKLLGIKVDNYVKVNVKAFRAIVDTLGGVYMDVPRNMNYIDPTQDLYINLKKGPQTLDGSKAEQLVRFRKGFNNTGYATGDVGRIEMQHLFLKALVKSVMSDKNLYSPQGMTEVVKIIYNYVETDMKLSDMYRYAKHINEFTSEDIIMETLPGTTGTQKGKSYFLYDPLGTQKTVKLLFSGEAGNNISKNHKIEIVNGSTKSGLASYYMDKLESSGYIVSKTGNSVKEADSYTKIIVRTEGLGTDLQRFFGVSNIEVIPELLEEDVDIKIILGKNETK